jgi:hypothetical protein
MVARAGNDLEGGMSAPDNYPYDQFNPIALCVAILLMLVTLGIIGGIGYVVVKVAFAIGCPA